MLRTLVLALVCACFVTSGEARHKRHHPRHHVSSHDPRPHAWCGYFARHNLVSRDPGREYNLAAKWAGYGRRAFGPAVGTLVVWRHHIGKIVGRTAHGWIVLSGNDGNAIRKRVRSVSNAIAFRWP